MATSPRTQYGAPIRHALLMIGSFAVAGYAIWYAAHGSSPEKMLIWFLGAVLLHDFVLFPAYSLTDRIARLVTRQRDGRASTSAAVPLTNHVRVPLLLSALLLLTFGSVIYGAGESSFTSASGLTFAPYLVRWALISLALMVGSALIYLVRRVRAGRAGDVRATS